MGSSRSEAEGLPSRRERTASADTLTNALEQFDRTPQAEQAGDVVRAGLKSAGIGPERVVVVTVALRVDHVHPADHQGPHALDQIAPAIKRAGALGTHDPFVAVGRQK